jgi:hypothetical protein
VAGSGGAWAGEVRASRAWLGVSAAGTGYIERIAGKPGEDTIQMNLWAFHLAGRLVQAGASELWLEGGLAALASSEFDSIPGGAWSLRGEHRLNQYLGLFGQFRHFSMIHDVSASEIRGGLQAWFLAGSYRALKFNVGPPLHGPEIALSLRF